MLRASRILNNKLLLVLAAAVLLAFISRSYKNGEYAKDAGWSLAAGWQAVTHTDSHELERAVQQAPITAASSLSGKRLPSCKEGECSYATFLCDDTDLPALRVLVNSLKTSGTAYPIEVLTIGKISSPAREEIEFLGGKIRNVWKLEGGGLDDGRQCRYSQLQVLRLENRKKVIWLSAETLVRKNLDHLFELDYDFAGIRGSGDIMDSGVLLLKPSMDHYARLLKHIKGSDLYEDSFQGLLHWYESSMPKLNIGTLGARYNVQAKDMQTGYCSKLFREACVFQYSSGMKPWSVHTRPSPRWETELHQGIFTAWSMTNLQVEDSVRKHFKRTRAEQFRHTHQQVIEKGSLEQIGIEDTRVPSDAAMIAHKVDNLDAMQLYNFTSGEVRIRKRCAPYVDRDAPVYPVEDRFSVVLNFFSEERLAMLLGLVKHYQESPLVHTIYLLWFNPTLAIPTSLQQNAQVTILQPATPSLNERFRPLPNLQTQAVFVADDDILYPLEDLQLAFEAWKERPSSQVGFFARMHRWKSGMAWYYEDKKEYSMILTKGVFINARYFHAYTCLLPPELHDYVDSCRNCEDVAMNMLIAGMTGAKPLLVQASVPIRDYGTFKGISAHIGHTDERSTCFEDLVAIFGRVTLQVSREKITPFTPNKFVKAHIENFELDSRGLSHKRGAIVRGSRP